MPADDRPATAPAPQEAGTGTVAALTGAFFGCWLVLLPAVQVTLALRAQEIAPTNKAAALSVVLAVGAAAALLTQNIIGALSDRTTSRFGRRRPWMAVGAMLGAASLVLLAQAPNVVTLVIAWALVQLTFNITLAVLNPVLPDQVPAARLGRVSGVIGLTQQVGTVAGVVLVRLLLPNLALAIILPGLVSLATIAILLVVMRDRRLAVADRKPFRLRTFLAAYWVNPRRAPDFAWAWLSRFLVYCGGYTLAGYQTYFLMSRFGFTPATVTQTILQLVLINVVAVVATSLFFGALSDRIRRRKPFVFISVLVQAAALVFAAFSPAIETYYVASLISGIASGCYVAVDVALVTEVLPSRADAGKDMGVFHLASVLPQTLVPMAAPAFLAIGGGENYSAFFLAGAVLAILGAVCNQRIRSVR